MTRSAIDQEILALLRRKEEMRLAAGRAAGVREQDHRAVYLERTPHQMTQVGCSCGYRSKTLNQRASTMFNSYMAHRRNIGLPRLDYYEPIFDCGPAKGLTYEEADIAGLIRHWSAED